MAPAAFSSSSSGGSSPATSPGFFTPVLEHAEMTDESNHNFATGAGRPDHFTTSAMPSNGTSGGAKQQPVAIVGMSCRLPGGVSSPAEFWELCSRARSSFTAGAPKDRFDHNVFYHANPGKNGAYHSQGGYFLNEDPAVFDAPFFSLTEKEATAMDPQQRLLLECTFEALESAGIAKHAVVGQQVGVFIGGSLSEYETHLSRDSDAMPMYQSTGCAHAMQSNRLSHFFDLRGPSYTLDTACSSSLVALHAACQSIRNGESSVAITGACHLNMMPDSFISFSTGRLLSDSGRSIAFDERGTGFGRGEGCGILVLKPLDRAIEDRDAIRAVILGTGINQDGKTAGITMPNGDAQETLIKQVYDAAGLDRIDCAFVEAHGTGTKIGDPTEAGAIYRALGGGRTSKDPLFIGSVKSNIGHLEAASGVAAVIKAALMLERGFILPNHDFKTPNTRIPWKEWNLSVPKVQRPWPKGKKYVSVNNFGFGGTNSHIILGKAPFPAKKPSMSRRTTRNDVADEKAQSGSRKLFLLSGNDKQSLETTMANLVVYLEQRPEIFQSDLLNHLCYTLSRRSLLKWRLAVPAVTSFQLIEALNSKGVIPTKSMAAGQGQYQDLQLGFIFTGQGAQWHAMGRELYGPNGYPAYTAALDRADQYLRRLGSQWSLIEELTQKDAQTSRVSEAHISQPACTAVQLCLVQLLFSWGIRPHAVTGHSSGEIAAAYAAGMISFESAMAVAYHRGRMIPVLKKDFPRLEGTMMAVGGSKEDFQPLIDTVNGNPELDEKGLQIRIACYNSPTSLTLSGDTAAVTQMEEVIKETQPTTFNRRLQVDVAYHSHHMNLVAKEYKAALEALPRPRSGLATKFFSSLYGRLIDGSECDASYWVDNLTRPVRFSQALDAMVKNFSEKEASVSMLVELGPHAALQGPVKQILQAAGVAKEVAYSSVLARKRSAVETALDVAAAVITNGGLLNVDAINLPQISDNDRPNLLTDLPRYAWNHKSRYWHDSRLSRMHTRRGSTGRRSELLGVEAIYSTSTNPTWRNIISLDDLPWIRHHRIQGVVMFPLGGFVAMAVEAASQRSAKQNDSARHAVELKDVEVLKPLVFPADVVDGNGSIELSISLNRRHDSASGQDWDEFSICSWSAGTEWTQHCAGLVGIRCLEEAMSISHQTIFDAATVATQRNDAVHINATDMAAIYTHLSESMGVDYGPSFQGIQECTVSTDYAVGEVSRNLTEDTMSTAFLHPTVLESVIDMYWPILRSEAAAGLKDTVYLPTSIKHMTISLNPTTTPTEVGLKTYCMAQFGGPDPRSTSVNVLATASPENGDVAAVTVSIDGLVVSPILDETLSGMDINDSVPRQLCYKYEWETLEYENEQVSTALNSALQSSEVVIIHGDTGSLSHSMAGSLASALESASTRRPELESGIFGGTTTKTCENIQSKTSGKTCIVLAEIDQPFLFNADQAQFEALKALASSAHRVLWVTCGAYHDSTSPSANMISGLSRTIRSETMMPFAHLDLQGGLETEPDCTGFSKVILRVLGVAFGMSGPKHCEMEFVYNCGALLIPRVVNDGGMDQFVHRDTDPHALELQKYVDATAGGRVLRLNFELAKSSPSRGHSGSRIVQGVHLADDMETASLPLADDEIEFEVKAVAVNRNDAVLASTDSSNPQGGVEASGIVTRLGSSVKDSSIRIGSPIACLTTAIDKQAAGAFASVARASASMVLQLPTEAGSTSPELSFEQATALPLAYCTAYYSLVDQARLEAGQKVLLTSASDALGQAAACVAVMSGAVVYVIAGSEEEKAMILGHHSGSVEPEHVFIVKEHRKGLDSATYEIYTAIMRATNGAGVDVVLDMPTSRQDQSCLDRLWKSCLSQFGCLVQVQDASLQLEEHGSRTKPHKLQELRPSSFLDDVKTPQNATYITVDMMALASQRPRILRLIVAKVADLLQQGKIAPIGGVEVFSFSRAHEVFNKALCLDKSDNKYVLVPEDDDMIMAPPHEDPASKKILKAEATYIIVGGTGGLGRSMAKWMVDHGAGHIVLVSRRADVTPAVTNLMQEAQAAGAKVHVRQCDVADESSVSATLNWIETVANLPPVQGIIHSAMVLRDVLFEKMTHEEYTTVIDSKVKGAWNLHKAFDGRDGASQAKLDFFVVMSSVSAVVGNRGQAAYAAANTFLDALVQHRLSKNLAAVSLALAAVSDAGYLADGEGGAARAADVLRNLGGDLDSTICESEVLALLHAAVTGQTASCQHHVITGVGMGTSGTVKKPLPFWAGDAKFTCLVGDAGADAEEGGADVISSLSPSLSQAEAEDVVCRGLVAKIAQVIMMDPDDLDVTRSLSHYPLDSLTAIEIRNFIAREYEASMQVLELLSSGSIQTLSSTVCRKSKLCQFS